MSNSSSEFGDSYDGLQQLTGAFTDQTLGDVPQREAVTVKVGTTIAEAVAAMNAKGTGYALVLEDGKLVGIVTERDVLTKVVGGDRAELGASIQTIMTRDPETLPSFASVAFALHRMSVEGYRHLPLVDDEGRAVGCVALRDIINWVVDMLPQAVLNLPARPGYPTSVDGG